MAYNMLREQRMISISSRQTHALHDDHTPPCMAGTGEIQLFPDIRSLRRAAREIYATVRCEYRQKGGQKNRLCPRTLLRRIQKEAKKQSLVVLNGFEIEMVFMTAKEVEGKVHYVKPTIEVQGHQYCSTRTLRNSRIMSTVESIVGPHPHPLPILLSSNGIQKLLWEFVLAPSSPLHAVDTLIAARDIISDVAAQNSLRATLYPKPYSEGWTGTGAHAHISIQPSFNEGHFYAGVLKHLRAIVAFKCPCPVSYERAVESGSSGDYWVSWGTLNRDTPLRKVEDSHYEVKCIDGLANMYLVVGAIIGAGLRGIADGEVSPIKDCQMDPAKLSDEERGHWALSRRCLPILKRH